MGVKDRKMTGKGRKSNRTPHIRTEGVRKDRRRSEDRLENGVKGREEEEKWMEGEKKRSMSARYAHLGLALRDQVDPRRGGKKGYGESIL